MAHRRIISDMDEQRIINAFENPELDYIEVAKSLGVQRGNALSIVRWFQRTGQVNKARGGNKEKKYTKK